MSESTIILEKAKKLTWFPISFYVYTTLTTSPITSTTTTITAATTILATNVY